MTFSTLQDFQTGTVLLIDKPYEWTSFQVVNKLRWLIRKPLGVKKLKVGHAGTLDPLATGLLVICTGKMTKQIQHFIDDRKSYSGEIHLGWQTDSYDLETELRDPRDIKDIHEEQVQEAANEFLGDILQKAPIFSAKKIDGKRAYELARKGEQVEMKSNAIHIFSFEIKKYENGIASFEVSCSKGTYIRSLAHDLGEKLGCGAYLKSLRRTQSGEFSIENAISIEQFQEELKKLL